MHGGLVAAEVTSIYTRMAQLDCPPLYIWFRLAAAVIIAHSDWRVAWRVLADGEGHHMTA